MNPWIYLSIAIGAEVAATLALKASEGFTKLPATSLVVIGYLIAFYCLSLALKSLSIGIAYAVWAGVGVVLVALLSAWLYRQSLDLPAIIGMAMIVSGVLVIQLFSHSNIQ